MEIETLIENLDSTYNRMKEKYDRDAMELERQRKEFYEKNPDYPFKTMFMQVTAGPQRFIINEIY